MQKRWGGFFPIFLAIIGVVIVSATAWGNYRYVLENPGGEDFLVRWLGANKWLTEGISPYDASIKVDAQKMLREFMPNSSLDQTTFRYTYPFYSMIFYAPIGVLGYTVARAIFMSFLEICAIGMVLIGLKVTNWEVSIWVKVLLVIFMLTWYHSVKTIETGSLGGVTALLAILGLYFIQQKQDVAAGVFLALSTSNYLLVYSLILFIFVWALSARRSRIILSTLGTLIGLFIISFALLDTWFMDMIQQIFANNGSQFIGSPISIISNSMPGVSDLVRRLFTIVAILYLLIEWFLAWGKNEYWFLWTASLTLVISNLITVQNPQTSYVILLPALFLVFRVWVQRWGFTGRYLVIISLLILLFGIWGLFFLIHNKDLFLNIVSLSLPMICLFGLWWVRWWAIRPPKLLLQDFAARFGGG